MSVNSKMTAIADKIRTLLGLTGTMGLDEMAAHLGTEQSNVTAALAAIAGKGVTVPDGSNSNSLASLIAGIEAGGGAKIATGSFTPTADCNYYEITHNLGEKPTLAICLCTIIIKGSFDVLYDDSTQRIVRFNSNNYLSGTAETVNSIINQTKPSGSTITNAGMYNATENTIKAGNELISSKFFLAGVQYIWIVAVI